MFEQKKTVDFWFSNCQLTKSEKNTQQKDKSLPYFSLKCTLSVTALFSNSFSDNMKETSTIFWRHLLYHLLTGFHVPCSEHRQRMDHGRLHPCLLRYLYLRFPQAGCSPNPDLRDRGWGGGSHHQGPRRRSPWERRLGGIEVRETSGRRSSSVITIVSWNDFFCPEPSFICTNCWAKLKDNLSYSSAGLVILSLVQRLARVELLSSVVLSSSLSTPCSQNDLLLL